MENIVTEEEIAFNGGCLDFSHLSKLENIPLKFTGKNNTNHQELRIINLQKKIFFDGVPLKKYVHSLLFLDFAPEIKKALWEYPVTYNA